MVAKCIPDPDPWRGVEFALTRPSFKFCPESDFGDGRIGDFMRSSNTLPDSCAFDVSPINIDRRPCCARHTDRPWLSCQVMLFGWGISTLIGTAKGTVNGVDLQVILSTDPTLRDRMARDEVRGPAVTRGADPGDIFNWLDARATVVQFALLAQLYLDCRIPAVRDNPLLRRHSDAWVTRSGVVHSLPARGFDLTNPRTY